MVSAQPDASIKRLVGGTSALEVIICTFVRLCLRLRLLLLLVVIRVWMPQAVYRLPSLRLALFLILHLLALLLIAIDGLVVEADAEALLLPLLLLVLLYALLIVALFVLVLVAILSLTGITAARYNARTGITAARLLRLLRLPRESLPPMSRRTHPPRCDCREATV